MGRHIVKKAEKLISEFTIHCNTKIAKVNCNRLIPKRKHTKRAVKYNDNPKAKYFYEKYLLSLSAMEYIQFTSEFYSLTGIDLTLYKEKQMKRRIDTRIGQLGFTGYSDYLQCLRKDNLALGEFLKYITINVTEFFRKPDHWEYLVNEVFPLLPSKPRVWSMACSTGEEAYSLVMSLAENLPLEDIHVLATDIDQSVIDVAKTGIYSEQAMANVPEEYRRMYYQPISGRYLICKEIKDCVEFRKMDVLQEQFPKGFDLILCRNLLIYFTVDAKDRVLTNILDSLNMGGYLFTGHTEQIIYYKQIGFKKDCTYLYHKPRINEL